MRQHGLAQCGMAALDLVWRNQFVRCEGGADLCFQRIHRRRVAVLDGGYAKWLAEGRDTDTGHRAPAPTRFEAHERPELWATKSDIEDVLAGTTSAALVCGLPPKEFSGEEGSRSRRGHIPGSISAPAGRLVDRETNALLSEPDLRAVFGPALDERGGAQQKQ